MEDIDRIWLWVQTNGITVLLILVGSVIAYFIWERILRLIIRRIEALDEVDDSELDRRSRTIGNVLHSAGVIVILATAVLMILPELGVNIAPLLASVGIVSLALGLGAQTMVKDVISGMFILMENQYAVGDIIEVQGTIGTVENITLRITIIRDITGAVHTIPMGDIRKVANKSRDWSRAIVEVGITYDEDVDNAITSLQTINRKLHNDPTFKDILLEEPVVTGVEGLDDWAVRLRVMVKTVPGEQWNVQRWLRRQIRQDFAQDGIDIAFPRQDVMIVNAADLQSK